MFNQFKKIMLLAVLATACAGDGGALSVPTSASGKLPFASASGVLNQLVGGTGAIDKLLSAPDGTSLNGLGLTLPSGFDDPSAKYVPLAGVYDSCITVTTSPYKKYVMDCNKVVDSNVTYDYIGTIDFIKNDTANDEYHYEFDYYWFQYATATTGEGGTYKGSYKSSVDGTVRTSESKFSNTFKDNRTNANHCTGNTCDVEYTHISNWTVSIDSADDSADIEGFLAFKGKSNFTNGGWDGDVDVSFEIKVENFIVNVNGVIQSGSMTMTDGSGNKTVITWSGGALGTVTYNGITVTL